MEFQESKVYWESRLRTCASFMEKIQVLEELLLFLEEALLKVLGEEVEEKGSPERIAERSESDLLEALVEALEALQKREANVLRAPQSRERALRKRPVLLGVEDLDLQSLLELYAQYLGGEKRGEVVLPDKGFEQLLEERRRVILALCTEGTYVPLWRFFEDCREKRAIIATFLVLLDLVFRNVLRLKQEENGGVFLGIAGSEVPSQSP